MGVRRVSLRLIGLAQVAACLVIGACGAASTPSVEQGTTPATPTDAASAASTTGATQSPPTGAPATTSTVPTAQPTPAVAGERPARADELGLRDIELRTPTSGAGQRPVLEWVPLADAAHYYVIVRAPSGRVYWGWRTSETSVPVGGLPQLSESAAGPAISVGMTWSVSAVDDEGRVIGLSGHRPISP